jgi:hypothetical protein
MWLPGMALLCACQTPRTAIAPTSLTSVQLAAKAAEHVARSEADANPKASEALAAAALGDADACLAQAPESGACQYYRGVALGLLAKAHPARSLEYLKSMLDALAAAERIDPNYDQAGPERVRALVLIRAPGWPVGPGDAEAGLAQARQAVALRPEHPPNVLALAEAQRKNQDEAAATASYRRARDLAMNLPASADRDEWLREAEAALQR